MQFCALLNLIVAAFVKSGLLVTRSEYFDHSGPKYVTHVHMLKWKENILSLILISVNAVTILLLCLCIKQSYEYENEISK